MKKLFYNFGVLLVALLVCACGTTKAVATTETTPKPQEPTTARATIIDWQGSEFGDPVPDWVRKAADRDYSAIASLPELNGKTASMFSGEGQDRDLLKLWVDTNDASGAIVRQIRQTITATAGTSETGNKDDASAVKKMAESATGIWSQTTVSGFAKLRDFWTQVKLADGKTEYRYYSIYGINTDYLQEQIDAAMGKVKAETEKEKEALDRLREAVRLSAIAGTITEEKVK